MGTLISAEDTWMLWTVLALSAALSIYLEQKYKWASKITGCILATLFTLILANLNIIPTDAPVYDAVWGMLFRLPFRYFFLMPMSKKSGKSREEFL